jgi:hypothetical protein
MRVNKKEQNKNGKKSIRQRKKSIGLNGLIGWEKTR